MSEKDEFCMIHLVYLVNQTYVFRIEQQYLQHSIDMSWINISLSDFAIRFKFHF